MNFGTGTIGLGKGFIDSSSVSVDEGGTLYILKEDEKLPRKIFDFLKHDVLSKKDNRKFIASFEPILKKKEKYRTMKEKNGFLGKFKVLIVGSLYHLYQDNDSCADLIHQMERIRGPLYKVAYDGDLKREHVQLFFKKIETLIMQNAKGIVIDLDLYSKEKLLETAYQYLRTEERAPHKKISRLFRTLSYGECVYLRNLRFQLGDRGFEGWKPYRCVFYHDGSVVEWIYRLSDSPYGKGYSPNDKWIRWRLLVRKISPELEVKITMEAYVGDKLKKKGTFYQRGTHGLKPRVKNKGYPEWVCFGSGDSEKLRGLATYSKVSKAVYNVMKDRTKHDKWMKTMKLKKKRKRDTTDSTDEEEEESEVDEDAASTDCSTRPHKKQKIDD